ncbi:FAD-binding domain-containing protein [Rubritepida flocculans]|uniref:FAD-binding domain-containing protein n=1 Tax=Rubritepida flocculans TaxID=182403 RepID=UPI00040BE6B5|nr:FAD-binding domain-containing protein [Rubritepida flocculans]
MSPELPAPSRAAGLARLAAFAPRMGRAYAAGRNTDPGPGRRADVSRLSAHVRHRLLLEEELVGAALARHRFAEAEKFVQEVFWRSYWKGFLALRPAMWAEYRARVAEEQARLAIQGGLRAAVERAMAGRTGLACFDAWARELVETGWLHNHARMWFASIWIFTLRLPWPLGAEFFRQHLCDADAASNTLSWRWVAGIQTPGKHYLARAENIARHTEGRFDPRGELDEAAAPLDEPGPPPPGALPPADPPPRGPVALLLHEEDLHPESLPPLRLAALGAVTPPEARAPLARGFTEAALADGLARAEARFGLPGRLLAPEAVADWAAESGAPALALPEPAIGPLADWAEQALRPSLAARGLALHRLRRPWDAACWPLARKGFFPFRESIPRLIAELSPRAP